MTHVGLDAYDRLLLDKVDLERTFGFELPDDAVNPMLMPHQRDIVRWCVLGGRRGIFARFGLGKTFMQLEILRLILGHAQDLLRHRGLIVIPLGMRPDFFRDAAKLGIPVRFVRTDAEVDEPGIYLTNYESVREGKLDPALFDVASLDEAAVLRSFGSKTYQEFLPLFAGVPYRFVATATPSPNRYKELIHYAGFLGVMDTGQALTRFFQRNSEKAGDLTLYPHKEREFWLWLNTWAVFLQRPSDLGYSDEGYDLPELEVHWLEVDVDLADDTVDRDGQGGLFRSAALGVVQAAREKRDSIGVRVAAAAGLVAESPEDHFLLWHDLEDERRALSAAIPAVTEVFGSLELEERERRVIAFADGEVRLLATKPSLSGSGCNFQRHCHRAVFVGVGFSFNDLIQAVHRIQRYGQDHPVRIDIIHTSTEREVVTTLQAKWAQHEDFGHTDDNGHFWRQMDHLTPQLLRILAPGRIYACHVKDRILFGNVTGAGVPTVSPFHAEAIFHAQKHGFDYLGMRTIVTDVVRENNQTYRLGWSEMAKDATKMGSGQPEYVLLFHKPQSDRTRGYADTPVSKDKADYTRARWQIDAHAFWRSGGDRYLTPDELAALPPEDAGRLFTEQTLRQVYDYESHVRIGEDLDGRGALPATFMTLAPGSWTDEVWHDVNRMRTLNTEQSRRAQAMHVCPLQFDVVDRLIRLYSNEGDLVFDPFGGLFTVPVRAVRLGRRGRAVELNPGYFADGVKYLEAEERKQDMPSLFDLEHLEVPA